MYADPTYADAYLDTNVFAISWFSLTDTEKTRALAHATRIIDNLPFQGCIMNEQPNQWPRVFQIENTLNWSDPILPEAIRQACVEIALALTKGVEPDMEYAQLSQQQQDYGQTKSQRNSNIEPHIVAGVPSRTAWLLMRPYLAVNTTVTLTRTI